MNTFLIVLIAFKLVCLFFCWKVISMTKKEKQKNTNLVEKSGDIQIAQNKLTELMEQNQRLSKAIEELKESPHSPKSKRTS